MNRNNSSKPFYRRYAILIILAGLILTFLYLQSGANPLTTFVTKPSFNGNKAYDNVIKQMEFGPRPVSSSGHEQTIKWIRESILLNKWVLDMQTSISLGHPITNIIAKRGFGDPWIIIAAHYDTRLVSDQDAVLKNQSLPVPGANDGASGVAILLELARVLPEDLSAEVWLVFFDAEDNGNLEGWKWLLGSSVFVDQLTEFPDYVVVLDMVGDAQLNIHMEQNSDRELSTQIWNIASELGYSKYFIPTLKYRILDDHIPFLEVGIKAIDIIDFDYPYWHTREDTADKVSSKSLKIVGDTIYRWVLSIDDKNR